MFNTHIIPNNSDYPISAGTVFIRQNLTSKDDPHAERIKIFVMAVNP